MFVHHLFGDAGVLKDMNVHPFVSTKKYIIDDRICR